MATTPLPSAGFLADASDALRDLLDDLATEVKLAKGDILFDEGDEGDALFAIMSGTLEFSTLSADGRRLALDVMRPGALFGEIALFDPGPRTATVSALTPTTLRRVRNRDLRAAIAQHPELGLDMISLAGRRMRWMNRQLSEQVFLPMPVRLARKVLYLTLDDGRTLPDLSLSQAELAEFVGATREAVSKTMAQWKREGVIESSRGGLKVLDRAALQVVAEFEQF